MHVQMSDRQGYLLVDVPGCNARTGSVDARGCRQQASCVLVFRRRDYSRDGPLFDDASLAHHHHVIGKRRDHSHVMSDYREGHVALRHQLPQQRQDLRLHRHVERRGRLIGDQQRRRTGQRHRDHRALPHATRQFVRILAQPARHIVHAHLLQQNGRSGARILPAHAAMGHQRLGNLIADTQVWRERGHRILEDHRDSLTAQCSRRPRPANRHPRDSRGR